MIHTLGGKLNAMGDKPYRVNSKRCVLPGNCGTDRETTLDGEMI